jgi:hypothetical protein
MEFLETDVRLNFKSRSSDWSTEDDDVKRKLIAMYGPLLEKWNQFDEIKIVK